MRKEIMLPYKGVDYQADKALLLQKMEEIESNNLTYFRNTEPVFKDEEHGHLRYHFMFSYTRNIVKIVQVQNSKLPIEITKEVFAIFKAVFEIKSTASLGIFEHH